VNVQLTASIVSALVLMAGVAPPDREKEKAVIAKVIRDSIYWALDKNRALQESTMAHDDDLFIYWTNSDSVVAGWKQYVRLFDRWMDPRFKATFTEVRDLRVNLSRSEDVAWFSAMLDDLTEWDGKPEGARNIRWTGVLEKRRGNWVIVQEHGSVPAARPPRPDPRHTVVCCLPATRETQP
jgi:hypothetical protein